MRFPDCTTLQSPLYGRTFTRTATAALVRLDPLALCTGVLHLAPPVHFGSPQREGETPGEVAGPTEHATAGSSVRYPTQVTRQKDRRPRPAPVLRVVWRSAEVLRQQSLVTVAHDPVAFARDRLQLRAIEHRRRVVATADEAGLLQLAGHAGRP